MKIIVSSYMELERYAFKDYILISISSTSDFHPIIEDHTAFVSTLKLSFDDIRLGGLDIMPVGYIFTLDHAEKILNFIDFFYARNNDYTLVINCEAGISRSSAIAAAITRMETGRDDKYFSYIRYQPNLYVYGTMIQALSKNNRVFPSIK